MTIMEDLVSRSSDDISRPEVVTGVETDSNYEAYAAEEGSSIDFGGMNQLSTENSCGIRRSLSITKSSISGDAGRFPTAIAGLPITETAIPPVMTEKSRPDHKAAEITTKRGFLGSLLTFSLIVVVTAAITVAAYFGIAKSGSATSVGSSPTVSSVGSTPTAPSTMSCCSSDGVKCNPAFANCLNATTCVSNCLGRWISLQISAASNCCSMDGFTCLVNPTCNANSTVCLSTCLGQYILKPNATFGSTQFPPTTPQLCCSTDGGFSCSTTLPSALCNTNGTACTVDCNGYLMDSSKAASTTTPFISTTQPSMCCSTDGGATCSSSLADQFCNSDQSTCKSLCSGLLIQKPATGTIIPPLQGSYANCCSTDAINCNTNNQECDLSADLCSSVCQGLFGQYNSVQEKDASFVAPECCSFDQGVSCGNDVNCDSSSLACQEKCFGSWILTPAEAIYDNVDQSIKTRAYACCSTDGGTTCDVFLDKECSQSDQNCLKCGGTLKTDSSAVVPDPNLNSPVDMSTERYQELLSILSSLSPSDPSVLQNIHSPQAKGLN